MTPSLYYTQRAHLRKTCVTGFLQSNHNKHCHWLSTVAHICNLSTQKVCKKTISSRLPWVIYQGTIPKIKSCRYRWVVECLHSMHRVKHAYHHKKTLKLLSPMLIIISNTPSNYSSSQPSVKKHTDISVPVKGQTMIPSFR